MIEIVLHQVDVNMVVDPATGARTMRLVDPQSGIAVRIDLPQESAQQLAAALTQSSLVVAPASALPAEVKH